MGIFNQFLHTYYTFLSGVCKYYIGPLAPSATCLCRLPQPPPRNRLAMYSFCAQKWYGLLSFWALSWLL